jgi:hypothetical protein
MIGMVLASAAMLTDPSAATREASVLAFVEYQSCLSEKASIADTFSDHRASPRDVALAAQRECGQQWRKVQDSVLGGASPSSDDAVLVEKLRSLAIGSAASDVVESRIGSCGSVPGPYQCLTFRRRSARHR